MQNQTINQITATLVHEVKNPVALIKANIDYIKLNDQNHLYDKNYRVIEKELKRISDIISDFMNITQDMYQKEDEVIFICDLISDIIDDYDISINNKEIKFIMECKNEDISFFGDYSKISILFFNIYKNAVEAIKQSGTIKTCIYKDDMYLYVDIIDNGEGISGEFEKLLGSPFFTTKDTGSGLGVYICKNIASDNGGSFELVNNYDAGCCAKVKLPLKAVNNKSV